jgi:5,10-methenyltetrahydrofolate synthetase
MEEDAYGIPKPKDTDRFAPQLLLVPCVGFGPRGLRLGYGGGFYDRTLSTLDPRPYTVGVGYAHGHIPWLEGEPHDVPLDAILTEDGVFWQKTD